MGIDGKKNASLITESIGRFISLDLRPYSVVEGVGFTRMINTIFSSTYKIHHRTTFSKIIIPKIYE